MAFEFTREYELKFYLNAQHHVVFDGKKGADHPHTWEFTLTIRVPNGDLKPFSVFENGVNDYLRPYQNQVLNDIAPFDAVMPTLESLAEEFAHALAPIIADEGGELVRMKASEGPTRSYVLRAVENPADEERAEIKAAQRVIDGIVGEALA